MSEQFKPQVPHFYDKTNRVVVRGDVIAYNATSGKKSSLNFYIVDKIDNKKVFVKGWKKQFNFTTKKFYYSSYSRRIWRTKNAVKISPTILDQSNEQQKLMYDYYNQQTRTNIGR